MKHKQTHALTPLRLLSDEELVYRYARRSEQGAMHVLYERYSHLVLGICLYYLREVPAARRITQEIFIRLLQDLPRFEITRFKPWLLQVCRNECQMQLRKMVTHHTDTPAMAHVTLESELPAGISPELKARALSLALERLSAEQLTCLRAFYEERKPFTEIAAGTGLPVARIRQYIQEGKAILQQQVLHVSKHTLS